MTVNELLTNGANGRHDDGPASETESNSSTSEKSSCFFQWQLLASARQEEDKFHCHLCQEVIEGSEIKLKLHQIGLHVNPYYLSASDRILAQISSYAVQTDKTEDPWVPDWDTFKGLYRCHHCFLLCNEGPDLSEHLNSSHPKEISKAEMPEDADEEEEPLIKRKTKSSSPVKRRESVNSEEDIPLAKKFKQEETAKQNSGRPDRKCKSTTNTLVAMLTADERYYDLQLRRRKSDDLITTTSEIKQQVPVAKTSSAKKSNAKKSSKSKKKSKVKNRHLKKKGKKKKMRDLSRGQKVSAAEQERIHMVNQAVTTKDKPFVCFQCQSTFESFEQLSLHKKSPDCSSKVRPLLLTTKVKEEPLQAKIQDDPELDDFVANALTSVPEVTFNNMHGTIHHISSLDGQVVASKTMGTLEKVKLNLSESWSKNDVWESGWEHSVEPLHWHRYNCLSKMSSMSWAQQQLFKDAYDHLKKPAQPQISKNGEKRVNLFQGLNLKQVGKSVKYMNITERKEQKNRQLKAKEKAKKNKNINVLNGEWENPHDFMCSSCAVVYDELREILHHKWEAHPYCLVAHVTLRQDLQLPPSNMMHPQVGRGLNPQPSVKMIGQRKSSLKLQQKAKVMQTESELKCSKCPPESVQFENRDQFYVHVLECGGHDDWDVSKKKKKKKRMLLKRNNSTEQPTNEEVIQRRKARFERFNRPPPLAVLNGGRMTRLQADIIKKDKRDKRKKGKASKKPRAKPGANAENPPAAAAGGIKKVVKRRTNFERPTNIVARQRRSTAFYGITNDPPTDQPASDQVRKIVQQIMEEMLTRIEQAAQVLNKAEEMNLDLETAKLQSRRNSTDSNCSLKVKDQGQAEPIIDLIDVNPDPVADDITDDPESLRPISVKKRRSSFAASFYSARPASERSLRRSNGKINYFQNDFEKEDDDDDQESSPIRRRKKQKVMPKTSQEMTAAEDEENSADGGEEMSRPRRQITNNNCMLMDSSLSSSSRVVFPLEVKACAIQRIRDGETQVQVARDLQCPVSTVASWWHRRASILASEATSDSNISSATESEPSEDLPLRKSKLRSPVKSKKKSLNLNRNVLLSQMKERVEAAFAAQEEEAQDTNEMINENNDIQDTITPEESEEADSEAKPLEIESVESNSPEPKEAEETEAKEPPKPKSVPSSEESSNDAPENNIKLKNTILRTCFASLHRRQKKEKEQEYHQYLNGFD